jgi:hypothetical protein
VIGEEREEIRVVPLGNVEGEMAAAVGLRRVACLGIKVSKVEIGRWVRWFVHCPLDTKTGGRMQQFYGSADESDHIPNCRL